MRILITRQLNINSIFKQNLEASGQQVYGESLIEFEALDFAPPHQVDWLFFYSKKGIDYYYQQMGTSKSAFKLAVLGKASAAHLKTEYGLNADFVGTGEPQSSAAAFLRIAAGQHVAFIRAKNSKQSVQNILKEDLKIQDIVVYKNSIRKNISIVKCDIAVLTSPMNTLAYFQNTEQPANTHYVVIGQSTAKQLLDLGHTRFLVAEEPSELGLLLAVQKILRKLEV